MIDEFEPKIVGFFCTWYSYIGADLAGTSRTKYPPNARAMCSGRVDIKEEFIPVFDFFAQHDI